MTGVLPEDAAWKEQDLSSFVGQYASFLSSE